MKKQVKEISLNDRNNKFLNLDTETIHSGLLKNGIVEGVKDIIEISWKTQDHNGIEILGSKKGYIVKEFWDNKEYLHSLNYEQRKNGTIVSKQNFAINKIKEWEKAIANGTLEVRPWGYIMHQLGQDIDNYGINLFGAYNILFDRGAIACTNEIISKNFYKSYCPKLWKLDFIDWMELVKVIAKSPEYVEWAINHGALTPKGKIKFTAETVFQFLTNNSTLQETKVLDSTSWSETHLAIEDIDCEGVIVQGAISIARRTRDIKVKVNCYGNSNALNKCIKKKTIEKALKKHLDYIKQLVNA